MAIGFQIGQCRISVDNERTKEFYSTLPKISENCACGDCAHFESEVITKDLRLFRILKGMGVDLARQPNVNPDGICSIGPTEKYRHAYLGYYLVFGKFGKTQRTPQTLNSDGKLESVDFYESEEDSSVQYKIKQDSDDRLIFDFYLECDKKGPTDIP